MKGRSDDDPHEGAALRVADLPKVSIKELNRRTPTVEVSLSELHVPEFEADPRFMSLWAQAVNGDIPVWDTRLATDQVEAGFLKDPMGSPFVDPPIEERVVLAVMNEIRQGRRPSLVVYEAPEHHSFGYLCSDDVVALVAYKRLGLSRVPVTLMSEPHRELEDARLEYRGDGRQRFHLTRCLPATRHRPYLVDASEPWKLDEFVSHAIDSLDRAIEDLRAFHRPGGDVHYHHILMSNLIRARRAISSVRTLLVKGAFELGLVVSRAVYELATSLYVDWLAPEVVGPAFADAARGSAKDVRRAIKEAARKLRDEGMPMDSAMAFEKGTQRLMTLALNVAERARLAPGGQSHDVLYHRLSSFAHQDARAASAFSGYLDAHVESDVIDKGFLMDSSQDVGFTLNWSLGLLLDCVRSDIGAAQSD